jgi:hypothetical protein
MGWPTRWWITLLHDYTLHLTIKSLTAAPTSAKSTTEMATNQSLRDATVILTDSSNWISWYRQLKIKCQSQDTWPLADPEGIQTQRTRPEPPLPPEIAQYEPSVNGSTTSTASSQTVRAGRSSARGTTYEAIETAITAPLTPLIPTRVSDLSNKGQEAYKEDREDYKL